MPTYPVFVEGWQQECCGEPFAVGDRVRWSLVLDPSELAPVEVRGELERFAGAPVVRAGDLRVLVVGPAPPAEAPVVSGTLREEHHDDLQGPATHGVVRRIRRVPGLDEVEACPESFGQDDEGVLVDLEVVPAAEG